MSAHGVDFLQPYPTQLAPMDRPTRRQLPKTMEEMCSLEAVGLGFSRLRRYIGQILGGNCKIDEHSWARNDATP